MLLFYLQLRRTISCVPSHSLGFLKSVNVPCVSCVSVYMCVTWGEARVRLNNRILESVRESYCSTNSPRKMKDATPKLSFKR